MDLNINGKIAVITGSDSGIGLETAKILADAGARIVLADLELDKLTSAAAEIRKHSPKQNCLP